MEGRRREALREAAQLQQRGDNEFTPVMVKIWWLITLHLRSRHLWDVSQKKIFGSPNLKKCHNQCFEFIDVLGAYVIPWYSFREKKEYLICLWKAQKLRKTFLPLFISGPCGLGCVIQMGQRCSCSLWRLEKGLKNLAPACLPYPPPLPSLTFSGNFTSMNCFQNL